MKNIRELVREDEVHSSVYTDPVLFQLEMQRLFRRTWLLVGHHSQIPREGDYVLVNAGDQPLILMRSKSGSIEAFYNRCPHRGARLKYGPGRSAIIVCPYHGWSFQLDGKLRFVPAVEEYEVSHCETRDLQKVSRLSLYRGFIFVKLNDGDDLSLEDFMGPWRSVIDDLVDRAPQDDLEIMPSVLRYHYRANWKLVFENLNDTLHARVAHGLAAKVAKSIIKRDPAARTVLGGMAANGQPVEFFQELRMTICPHGHSYFEGHLPNSYEESLQQEYQAILKQARGEEAAKRILSTNRHLGLLYPSSTWQARYQTVRIVQPLAPDLTEVVSMCFRLKGAPEGTLAGALNYWTEASSPLSIVITDDLDIYEGIQSSIANSDFWMSLGRGGKSDDAELAEVPATSEGYIRGQYRAWVTGLEGN